MLANWIKETTATTGAGTITLDGAVTGFIAFDDHPDFVTGSYVEYAIESGNNREAGIGKLTLGGTDTLERTKVLETLVSGTFDNTSPTAISLAGTSTVICTLLQQNAAPYPLMNQVAKNSSTETLFTYPSSFLNPSNGATVPTSLQCYAIAHRQDSAQLITEFMVDIVAAGTATDGIRFGFYKLDPALMTSSPLIYSTEEFTDLSTAGNNLFTPATPFLLPPGDYLAAIMARETGALTVRRYDVGYSSSVAIGKEGLVSNNGQHQRGHYQSPSQSTLVLPDPVENQYGAVGPRTDVYVPSWCWR